MQSEHQGTDLGGKYRGLEEGPNREGFGSPALIAPVRECAPKLRKPEKRNRIIDALGQFRLASELFVFDSSFANSPLGYA